MFDVETTYLISSNLNNGANTTTSITFPSKFYLRSLYYDSEAGVETIVKCGTTQISRTTGGTAKAPTVMNYECRESPFTIFFQNTAVAVNQIQAEFSYLTMNTEATSSPFTAKEFYNEGILYSYNPLHALVGISIFVALLIGVIAFAYRQFHKV